LLIRKSKTAFPARREANDFTHRIQPGWDSNRIVPKGKPVSIALVMQELAMGTDRTSIRRVSRIVLAALLSLAAVASAKAFEVTAEQRAACTPDALRLCASEIPDIGRITACMMAKQASLSPRCRAVFQTASLGPPASHRHAAHRIASSHASYRMARAYRLRGRHLHGAVEVVSRYRDSHSFDSVYVAQEPFASRNGRWMHSRRGRQALSMARKILVGFAMACQNHSIPDDLCNLSESSSQGYAPSGYHAENNSWGSFFGLSF
jgi:hypothetical protein